MGLPKLCRHLHASIARARDHCKAVKHQNGYFTFHKLKQGCLGGLTYLGNACFFAWVILLLDAAKPSIVRWCYVKMASGGHHDLAARRHGQDPKKGTQTLGPEAALGGQEPMPGLLVLHRPQELISAFL